MQQITDYGIYNVPPYILTQYDSSDLLRILEAGDIQFNEIEVAFWALRNDVFLDTAVGIQLDVLGKILGVDRIGRTDDQYRILLKIKALVNTSAAVPETIIQVMREVYQADVIEYEHIYPAKIQVFADGDSPFPGIDSEMYQIILALLPAGVGLSLLVYLVDDSGSFFVSDGGEEIVVSVI